MMQFTINQIQGAAKNVAQNSEIEVTLNADSLFVIAEHSQAINEFELNLAASTLEWDGDSTDGRQLLDNVINIQGERVEFRPRKTTDEWQARYAIVAR